MRWAIRLLVGAVLCAGSIVPVMADKPPWDVAAFKSAPDEVLKALADSQAPDDAAVEILLYDVKYAFDEQGRRTKTFRTVYRCLTRKGAEDWSYENAVWTPWYQHPPSLRARVITSDGKIHELDPKSIGEVPVEQNSPNVYSDRRMIQAPLPAVSVGAIVETETATRDAQPFSSSGTVDRFAFASFVPARNVRLTVEAPVKLPLKLEVFGSDLKPKRSESDGRVQSVFEIENVEATTKIESLLPPEHYIWPTVIVSTAKSWREVAAEYSKIVEAQIDTDAVAALAKSAAGNAKSRDEIAARLLGKMRQLIRYTGVEFGEAAIVPRSPKETLARRYGDCKDQATLLVSMLRAAGVDAQVALLKASDRQDLELDFPGLNAFNHAIVFVPGDPPLWIDPTARFVPPGNLPVGDQGRWALVAEPKKGKLTRTPATAASDNVDVQSFVFYLSESGKGKVEMTSQLTGWHAEDMRAWYASQTEKQIREGFIDQGKQQYQAEKLTRLKYTDLHDLSTPFRIDVELGEATVGYFQDGHSGMSVHPGAILKNLPYELLSVPEESSKRGVALQMTYPYSAERRYRIVPPDSYVPDELPEDSDEKFGPARLTQTFEKDGNSVTAVFRFDSGKGRFTPEEVAAIQQRLSKLCPLGNVDNWVATFNFTHVAAKHLAEGRTKEALQEYKRLVDESPKDGQRLMDLAIALRDAGFGGAAKRYARRAVELVPDSALLYAKLGRVLICDDFGRRFSPGMDRAGALEAYRRSLQLDPSNVIARTAYAIALERDADGDYASPDADDDEALKQYARALEDSKDFLQIYINHALLLLRTGRDEQFKQAVRAMPESVARQELELVVAALEGGADAALRQAQRKIDDKAQRVARLASAADHLNRARHYEAAGKLYDTIAPDTQNEFYIRRLALTMRSLERVEVEKLPADEPTTVVKRLYATIESGGSWPLPTEKLFAAGSDERTLSRILTVLENDLRRSIHNHRKEDITPARRADLVSLLKFDVESDKSLGAHRITARRADWVSRTFYVVEEDGGFRIRLTNVLSLGRAALEHIEKGELDKAAKWLQWALTHENREFSFFNPFTGSPFSRVWRTTKRDDPAQMRLAAAIVMSAGGHEGSIAVLEKERENAGDYQRLQIDRALMNAYYAAKQYEKAVETADAIQKDYPIATEAFELQIRTFRRWEKFKDVSRLIADRLDKTKKPEAIAGLAVTAGKVGDFATAEKHFRELVSTDRPGLNVYNELAWNSLFQGAATQQSLDDATKSVEQFRFGNTYAEHTLATVCAELGKTAEAMEHLRAAIEGRHGQLIRHDWYVLGRVAEQYEFRDIAKELYQKVGPPDMPAANDVHLLARRALERFAE